MQGLTIVYAQAYDTGVLGPEEKQVIPRGDAVGIHGRQRGGVNWTADLRRKSL